MPQITLKLSHNINLNLINLRPLFVDIHELLGKVPHLDNKTCFSGVLHEDFSYIGQGDDKLTKIFLEILWLETPERKTLKPALGSELMAVLALHLSDAIERQGLIFQPRVRIANLGAIEQDYHIYKPGVGAR